MSSGLHAEHGIDMGSAQPPHGPPKHAQPTHSFVEDAIVLLAESMLFSTFILGIPHSSLPSPSVCTFEPKLYLASQRLLETSATVPAYFPERQKYFELKKQERLQQLQADEVGAARVALCCLEPAMGSQPTKSWAWFEVLVSCFGPPA